MMILVSAFAFIPVTLGFLWTPIEDSPVVKAPVGDIVGSWQYINAYGKDGKVAVFMGIPYAEAPVGNLRFRKPVPKATLPSPFHATKLISCLQEMSGMTDPGFDFSEDCLIANVYVPAAPSTSNIPVMIWIHGGGFIAGSSVTYHPEYMATLNDVIVVTINYRLAVYGFLSTDDANSKGNYGLWDQHLAIRWVNNNIGAFGGDSSKVTIFGESAGAASVIYQAIYPGNKGLVNRVIAESGTASSRWAVMAEAEPHAQTFAMLAGCSSSKWADKMTCLRNLTSGEMNSTLTSIPAPTTIATLLSWGPTVDGEFVLRDPRSMFKNSVDLRAQAMFNTIDLMIGVNSMDGLVYVNLVPNDSPSTRKPGDPLSVPREQYNQFVNDVVKYVWPSNATQSLNAAAQFAFTDWTNPQDNSKRIRKLTAMLTDVFFTVPSLRTASIHAAGTSDKHTFMYEFAMHPPKRLIQDVPASVDGPESANHFDEVAFVFGGMDHQFGDTAISTEQITASKAVMTMWSNFAKSGDPNVPTDVRQYANVSWPQYDNTSKKYLRFTSSMGPESVKQRLSARSDEWVDLMVSISETDRKCPAPVPSM